MNTVMRLERTAQPVPAMGSWRARPRTFAGSLVCPVDVHASAQFSLGTDSALDGIGNADRGGAAP